MPTSATKPRIRNIEVDGLPVELRFKRMKSIRMHIDPPDGRVWVSVPIGTPVERIERLLREHTAEIRRRQELVRVRAERAGRDQFERNQVQVLGTTCEVGFDHDVTPTAKPRVRLESGRLVVSGVDERDSEAVRTAIETFRLELLREQLESLMPRWEAILGRNASWWGVRRMKTRWGSCSVQSGRIRFSTNLAQHHPRQIEYVVLHELVHLFVPNHGPHFVALMNQHMPDWRSRRAVLRGRTSC